VSSTLVRNPSADIILHFTSAGAQFVQLWNTSSNLQSMILSYEVAFDTGFDFVKVSHHCDFLAAYAIFRLL
jgi:hypothetical protein